jgi:hypothetical protein
MGDSYHRRDRRDHSDEQRNDEPCDTNEDQYGLAVAGYDIEVVQRLRDPGDRSQTDNNDQKGAERRWENVAADDTHHRYHCLRD